MVLAHLWTRRPSLPICNLPWGWLRSIGTLMFNRYVVTWLLTVFIVGCIIGASIHFNKTDTIHVGDHVVICDVGFFYNMDTVTLDDMEKMEETYNRECSPMERDEELQASRRDGEFKTFGGAFWPFKCLSRPAGYTLYRQAVVIYDEPSQLVVNMEVSPAGHRQIVYEAYMLNSETSNLKPES